MKEVPGKEEMKIMELCKDGLKMEVQKWVDPSFGNVTQQ